MRCVALRSLTNMLRKLNRAGAADTDAFSGALGCRVVSAALGVTSWAAADAGAAAGASTTTVSFAGTSIEAPRALGRVLIARLADAKSSVRRAALSAFLAALECVESEEQDERLPALLRLFAVNAARSATAAARCLMVVMRKVAQLCADETLSVRKIAIQALAFTLRLWCGGASARDSRSAISPLVASAVAAQLRALWVKQGLPLLGDGEASVRHACASTVAALLVAPIAESSHDAAATAAAAATTSTTEATNAWALLGTVAADASTKSSVSAAMRLLYSGNVVGCDAPDVVALLTVLMVTVERSLGAAEAARAAGSTEAAVKRKVACERLERGAWALLLELVKCCATEELAIVPTLVTFFLDVWRSVDRRECSFIYRYILHESCSQFDSLPLTSLTVVKTVRAVGDIYVRLDALRAERVACESAFVTLNEGAVPRRFWRDSFAAAERRLKRARGAIKAQLLPLARTPEQRTAGGGLTAIHLEMGLSYLLHARTYALRTTLIGAARRSVAPPPAPGSDAALAAENTRNARLALLLERAAASFRAAQVSFLLFTVTFRESCSH